MATVFGWKRKVGKPSRKRAAAFDESEQQDDEGNDVPFELDWQVLVPKAKGAMLEDIQSKSHRLRDEGVALAEQERLDEIPNSFKIYLIFLLELQTISSVRAWANRRSREYCALTLTLYLSINTRYISVIYIKA